MEALEEPQRLEEPLLVDNNKPFKVPCCRAFVNDMAWAVVESHEMILDFCCPCIRHASPDDQRAAVRHNPLYWAILLVTVPCILSGRWTHALFGQGGPVRDDELDLERKVRIQWIYAAPSVWPSSILPTRGHRRPPTDPSPLRCG